MNLSLQFKSLFYSFIYGMFFLYTYKLFRHLILKNKIVKVILEFLFCLIHVILFYYFLYKINNGILSFYLAIFLSLGMFFCKILYFNDKNH